MLSYEQDVLLEFEGYLLSLWSTTALKPGFEELMNRPVVKDVHEEVLNITVQQIAFLRKI
jgi:hypothetical protein